MRKQTQECLSTGFTNAKVRLDALWSIQPHRRKCLHLVRLLLGRINAATVTAIADARTSAITFFFIKNILLFFVAFLRFL